MGVIRFQVPAASQPEEWPELSRAYVAGYDNRVFPCRIEREDDVIICRRQVADSGMFHIAWPVKGFGRPILTTSSLAERERPYLLVVELARGKLALLRDQLAAWEQAGMTIPEEVKPTLKEAHRYFGLAACQQETVQLATEMGQRSLECTLEATDLLTRHYGRLRLMVRSQRSATLPVAFGCQMGYAPPTPEEQQAIPETFTASIVPVEWKRIEPSEGSYNWDANDAQVEWGQKNRLFMVGGPLLDLSPNGLPDWLRDWDHDFFNLQSFVCDFVETAISRYMGTIRIWEVAARANTGGALTLTEENRLNLVARSLEVARAVDQEIQLTIRVDQPFSDYQAKGLHRLTAWQFVDALTRMGTGLSAINLEFAIGYRPHGCDSRDLMEFSKLLDQWSMLALPLFVTFAFPSSMEDDPKARNDRRPGEHTWRGSPSPERQAEWIEAYVPIALAKQSVVGMYWSNLTDSSGHDYPNAGLFDASGNAKPAYDAFNKLRARYW